jgi:hypothetical protein
MRSAPEEMRVAVEYSDDLPPTRTGGGGNAIAALLLLLVPEVPPPPAAAASARSGDGREPSAKPDARRFWFTRFAVE